MQAFRFHGALVDSRVYTHPSSSNPKLFHLGYFVDYEIQIFKELTVLSARKRAHTRSCLKFRSATNSRATNPRLLAYFLSEHNYPRVLDQPGVRFRTTVLCWGLTVLEYVSHGRFGHELA